MNFSCLTLTERLALVFSDNFKEALGKLNGSLAAESEADRTKARASGDGRFVIRHLCHLRLCRAVTLHCPAHCCSGQVLIATGLHLSDVQQLIDVLQAIVDNGNTMVVIEHNLEIIKAADYIIDLGPEGGEEGGTVVTQGSPLDIIKNPNGSHTARYLKQYLKNVS